MRGRGKELTRPDRVWSYFALEKWPLAVVTVSGILYNVGLLAGPLFEGLLAQCLYEILRGTQTASAMLRLAGAYVLVTGFVQSMRYLKRFYVRRFANDVNRNMKRVLYHSLVHLSRPELERESVGSMMTRAIADVDACAEGMRKFTTEVFDTGVVMAAYLGLLLVYDWRLALLCGLFPPVAFWIAARMKKRVSRCAAAYKESAGQLNGATLDRVSGALTYRVFGLESRRDADYEVRLADYEKRAVAVNLWETSMPPLYQMLSMLGVIPILYLGAKNVGGVGWAAWDIAAFTTFLACFKKLSMKASKAAKLFNAVQKAQVSWKRIQPLLGQSAGAEAESVPPPPAPVTVSKLSFSYPQGKEIFRGVSFTVRPGQIIGVTGPVACGKSTLGKAFLCETPYGGSIRFGERELSELAAAHSSVVGYLGHGPELLSVSIAENILLGSPGDAAPYLRAVCLDDEVAAMPDGPDTLVGDAGVRLSGGQQARLALARTLCHRRPILILDDPFSAVDRETERQIFENLRQLAGDSVVLLLSHRLDLFAALDQVLWMERAVVTAGTHESLLAAGGEYASMYRAQTGGEEDAH